MKRKDARKELMSLCFEYAFRPDVDPQMIYSQALETRLATDEDYIRNSFFGIISNLEFIDGKISEFSNGWKLQRISPVALATMRTAIYEIWFCDDIPDTVAVNEAVEMIREFDDEKKMRPFVNGVLNAVMKSKPQPDGE